MARSVCWPAGTTSCTRPILYARSEVNSSHRKRWYMASPQPALVRKRKCAPPNGAIPRLDSIWQNLQSSAAQGGTIESFVEVRGLLLSLEGEELGSNLLREAQRSPAK